MAQPGFEEISKLVEEWFYKLQYERKFKNTNMLSKIVNNSSKEIQEGVRQLISQNINIAIEKCFASKNLTDMINISNAINGCFDNFNHAIDAIKYSIPQLFTFIDFAINECHLEYLKNGKAVVVTELLHCLSRILILILKLRRSGQYESQKDCNKEEKEDFTAQNFVDENKCFLSSLTHKIGLLLLRDDVLFDTKNNFAMSGILIRELMSSGMEELIQYEKKFSATISPTLAGKNSEVYLLQFLISSAIINMWSSKIIDEESTYIYLNFFIYLCENFSSETPIVLNASRTLLLLIKYECFKKFLAKADKKKIYELLHSLLPCIFMLLEHPVSCVRNSSKDFLPLLVSNFLIQECMIEYTFKLPQDKRSYFISLAALADKLGSRILIKKNNNLPAQLFESLYDPTIISHVTSAIESVILNDSLAEENFLEWCELWIIPLLISLMSVLPIIAAEIDKILEKIFKKHPNCVVYVTEKWIHPTSREELRCVITALKISCKLGFNFKVSSDVVPAVKSDTEFKSNRRVQRGREKKLGRLVNINLLKHCLHQGDDEIRISAFSLLVEARKTSEIFTKLDFDLILYFLNYNLNNQQPATRQKILSLTRKMLDRFSYSRSAIRKETKEGFKTEEAIWNDEVYEKFLDNLVEFCFSNIFVGCNFNRLNTVLNILLLCFELLKDMSFKSEKTDYYWTKFLIALDSSYEENKELAVILSKNLDYNKLDAAKPESTRQLFEKSFRLIAHMEPPDVLTGSYLLQILINLPLAKEVLLKYFVENIDDNDDIEDIHYHCIKLLTKNLSDQVALAKLDLMTAATCGPMYGTLFAIRLIFKNVNFSSDVDGPNAEKKISELYKWKMTLTNLIDICFEMIPIVSSVVNSSSPEGHLPMDFQTDFKNLLKIDCAKSRPTYLKNKENDCLLKTFHTFIKKFKMLENDVKMRSDFDAYETLRVCKCLLKENELILLNANVLNEFEVKEKLLQINDEIKKIIKDLDENNSAVDWPATAQVLLLCAWRSIKEAALYLGDFICKLPIITGIHLGFLSEALIFRIGEELKLLLCEIKHRGSFEHVYLAFTSFVNSLWQCPDPHLNKMPRQWLEEIASHLELPTKDQTLKLCSTRRSAGLPFLVQAVICSEIISVKSPTPSTLHIIMKSLFKITEQGVSENSDSKIHALNILRALFKHAQLGEHVSSYIAKAIMAAIRGSRGYTWPERNSSNLLFSSLIIRIFGVTRSRDEISKKNRMTSRTFFQRYSELYEFLLSEMKLMHSKNKSSSLIPKPSLYLILLILGRLYSTPKEASEAIDLSEFLPYINESRSNPTAKIRELAARALVPLIPPNKLINELNCRFLMLNRNCELRQNEMHGILLQIKALLIEPADVLESICQENAEDDTLLWIENTKWILSLNFEENISFITVTVYIKILHILFKRFHFLRKNVSEVVLDSPKMENLCNLSQKELRCKIGVYLCLEYFYYLKIDILGYDFLHSKSCEKNERFFKLLLYMLKCKISEVQLIPLKIFCALFGNEDIVSFSEDDFVVVGAPASDLLILRSKENLNILRMEILQNREILKCLFEPLSDDFCQFFKSKSVHRLWLKACSNALASDSINKDAELNLLFQLDSLNSSLKSSDAEISSNALIIYSIYIFKEIALGKNGSNDEKVLALVETLKELCAPDADSKEKFAVAKILNHCFDILFKKNIMYGMKLSMVPLYLLLDEDPKVRLLASEIVFKMQTVVSEKLQGTKPVINNMDILDWPICHLVPLKTQECLLDFYIIIFSEQEQRIQILVEMVVIALSSFCNLDRNKMKDEFGVFEKGNPNPYCEELAVSNLICNKISDWRDVINLKSLLREPLNKSQLKFLCESFNLTNFLPLNLIEVIEKVTQTVTKRRKKENNEFSMCWLQRQGLINAINFSERINSNVSIELAQECYVLAEMRRKLKNNVWKKKVEKKLLVKADLHYKRIHLQKYFSLWLVSINKLLMKRFKRRLARTFYENKVKTKTITALKKYAENQKTIKKCIEKETNENLKSRAWHKWKHYTLKRLKMKKVKCLASKIREERLVISLLYFWRVRTQEKCYFQEVEEKAYKKYEMKLKKTFFEFWKIYRKKKIFKKNITKLTNSCYQARLKERTFFTWKRYSVQNKYLRILTSRFQTIREKILIEHHLNKWWIICEKTWREKAVNNERLALNFHRKNILTKYFVRLLKAKDLARLRREKVEEFNNRRNKIYLTFYLDVWKKKVAEKLYWNALEEKADTWRAIYCVESFLDKIYRIYRERKDEKEEIVKAIQYSNQIILLKVFGIWKKFTVEKFKKKNQLENCVSYNQENIKRKVFKKWKIFVEVQRQKKIATNHYSWVHLSKAMALWLNFVKQKKNSYQKVDVLKQTQDFRLLKKIFNYWKNQVHASVGQMNLAVLFDHKRKMKNIFLNWKKLCFDQQCKKAQYQYNVSVIKNLIVKNYILYWYKIVKSKQNVNEKIKMAEVQQCKRLKKVVFIAWLNFIRKLKDICQRQEFYPEVKSKILLETYVIKLLETVKQKNAVMKKEKMADETNEIFIKRKFLKKWISFNSWRTNEEMKYCCNSKTKKNLKTFSSIIQSDKLSRRQPIIPEYLKINFNAEGSDESFTSSAFGITYRIADPVNKQLPIIHHNNYREYNY